MATPAFSGGVMYVPLTREEGLIWGYRHTDYHLRQFAL